MVYIDARVYYAHEVISMEKKPESVEEAKIEMAKTAGETAGESTGACVYNAGGKTYCAVLTQGQCGQLHGIWYAGRSC